MRILWLSPYIPVPVFGGGTRVFNLIKALAPGCDIDLIACAGTEDYFVHDTEELRSLCSSVEIVPSRTFSRSIRRRLQLRAMASRRTSQSWMYFSPIMQARIDSALKHTQYDVVLLEHSFMGYYATDGRVPRVLDQHNVESDILRRSAQRERSLARRVYNFVDYMRFRPDEKRFCLTADLVLAASGFDEQTMRNWVVSTPIVVVPNGVDSANFAPQASDKSSDPGMRVVFTGSMHYAPNAEAMLYFASEIWPIIRATVAGASLQIVGGDPSPDVVRLGRLPGVSVIGYVADLRPYLAQAQVVVAPLRIGGGTRLKILEALSMCKAVVSTPLGSEGLDVVHGRHLLVADNPADFASAVVALLEDAPRRETLGAAGRRLVEERYDWTVVGACLQAALIELVEQWDSREQLAGSRRH